MEASVTVQTMEFIHSAVLGVLLGVMYDVFRLLRTYIKPGRFFTAVLDVVYWLVAILALLAFVLTFSQGQMRWYVLLGAFSGGFVYICTFSRLFFRTIDIIIKLCIRLLRWLVKPIYFISGRLIKTARRTEAGIQSRLKSRRERKQAQDEE